jgi:hypothetical protein
MSEQIDARDYGQLEAQVMRLIKDVDSLTENVQAMRALMEQSKGGWQTLVWLGGLAGSLGAISAWVVAHIKVN